MNRVRSARESGFWINGCAITSIPSLCEERSDEAIHFRSTPFGSRHYAREDIAWVLNRVTTAREGVSWIRKRDMPPVRYNSARNNSTVRFHANVAASSL